jgi:nucleoside phosphorylase
VDAGISQWKKTVHGQEVTAFSTAISKMGQAFSAVETSTFLARTGCSFVVLSGIAGSLKRDEIKKRDVVIGQKIFWKGQNKVIAGADCAAAGGAMPKAARECCDVYRASDYRTFDYETDLDRKLQIHYARLYPNQRENNFDKEGFGVHVSDILTWDYVLSHKRLVSDFNRSIPSAGCVEMEAGGFRESLSRYSKVRNDRSMYGFVVRGISDYADEKDSDAATRTAASGNAAIVGIDLAESFFDPHGLSLV